MSITIYTERRGHIARMAIFWRHHAAKQSTFPAGTAADMEALCWRKLRRAR